MFRREYIKNCAVEAGFELCGVARARPLTECAGRFEAALEASGEGRLEYLARRPDRRLDPSALLSGARSVVVCGMAYDGWAGRDEAAAEGGVSAGGRIAAFALIGEDYHVRIKRMLGEMAERLKRECPGLRTKLCCDTAPIQEKVWAVEAGLGWQGRNSLLVNPSFGSFVLLGEIVMDEECDRYDEPFTKDGCGGCRRCEAACPTGALRERTVDTGRCISALTVERARLDPEAPREPIHGWIWGCDVCQRACPENNS